MKNILKINRLLISFLLIIPTTTVFTQSVVSQVPTQLLFTKPALYANINLQNNLFRWDPAFQKTLSVQKAMATSQQYPYLNLYTIEIVSDKLSPKIYLQVTPPKQPSAIIDALMTLSYEAIYYFYDRSQWTGHTQCIPMALPVKEGPTIETQFINCGGNIQPYSLTY